LATSCLSPLGARAQNATWSTTASGDFNNANNWTPTTVPTGTAFFGASNSTFLGFSAPSTVVGGWTFNPGASPYDFFVGGLGGQSLDFNGAGIVVNGGSAAISIGSVARFLNGSTAGSATITVTSGSQTRNGGQLHFFNNSTAGSATITTNFLGLTTLRDNASGGQERFITQSAGSFDISWLGSGGTTVGSIEGAGVYNLGSKQLVVGGNNLSTLMDGVIADGGLAGGTGASLVKVGSGTLTLGGANTYSGGTTVNAGILQLGAGFNQHIGSLAAGVALAVNGGTFNLNGYNQTVGALSGTGGIISLGANTLTTNSASNTTLASVITGTGGLVKQGSGVLALTGNNTYSGGTTVSGGLINFSALNNFGTGTVILNSGGLQWAAGTTTDISSRLVLGGAGTTFDTGGRLQS
jgi:autotransporter-associated beta strand protein